jgi:hypothetical protein
MNVREIRPAAPQLITPSAPSAARLRRAEAPAAGTEQPGAVAPSDVLSGAEKDFFAGAFPSAASELRAPAAYRKDGAVTQSGLGQMIDRKG